MSIVSVKDFGEALGISGGTIRSKLSRKQLCCNKKGFIDTENPKNYIYLLEVNGGNQSVFDKYHQGVISKTKVVKKTVPPNKSFEKLQSPSKKKVSVEKASAVSEKQENDNPSNINTSVNIAPTVETKKTEPKKVTEKLTLEEKRRLSEEKKANDLLLSFEIRKKEAEVKLVERNAELRQWELEKKAGSTLPVNMIEKVVGINFKAIYKSIKSQSKNIAMVMVQQLGGSKEDLDNILMQLDDILDGTVKDAEKKSSVDIEKLIEEYSEIRSRGERKV
jgi:hypothetical protein